MAIYLLHFSGSLGTSGRNAARHYLGWAPDGKEAERIAEHVAGAGARITAAARQRGYDLILAKVLPGDRKEERRLKNRGHFTERCPLCQGDIR